MAIAIVRDDLLGHAADTVPTMMNYTTLLAKDSMYNTPPCWCIYMTGLVLKYLENDIGGLENMQKINEAKAGSCTIIWTVRSSSTTLWSTATAAR